VPDTPSVDEKDPVVAQSLSALIVVFSLLLILSLVWAVYDEIYGLRPWKGFQHQFVTKYTLLLEKMKPRSPPYANILITPSTSQTAAWPRLQNPLL
jgi:hypothetical protein